MPRTVSGFVRTNGQYTGDVWNQDLINDVKIIASRHDTHDQDLADEIFNSLPRDGAYPMTGNLDFGSNKGINLAAPEADTDVPRLGDTITDATWDSGASNLTLVRASAGNIVVNIPGGGSGSVTQVDVGVGLTATPDPLTTTGEIKMADMAGNSIKLRNAATTGAPADVKVSALTEEVSPGAGDWILGENSAGNLRKYDVGNLPGGGGGSTNLTVTQTGAILRVNSDTGTDATLSPVDSNIRGIVTPAQFDNWEQKLDAARDVVVTEFKDHVDFIASASPGERLNMWTTVKAGGMAGVFAGTITTSAPADGTDVSGDSDVFEGYVYFEVNA